MAKAESTIWFCSDSRIVRSAAIVAAAASLGGGTSTARVYSRAESFLEWINNPEENPWQDIEELNDLDRESEGK